MKHYDYEFCKARLQSVFLFAIINKLALRFNRKSRAVVHQISRAEKDSLSPNAAHGTLSQSLSLPRGKKPCPLSSSNRIFTHGTPFVPPSLR